MSRIALTVLTVAVLGGSLASAASSKPVIGMALAQGGASVDDAKIFGSATLFEGTSFRADGYSRLALSNGTRLDLGAGTQAQIFSNHVALQHGLSEVQSGSGFSIEARTLTIRPDGNSIARVSLDGTKAVLVTALLAPVNVLNHEGLLVARVMPNLPMSFVPQAGAASAFSDTGCVVNKSGVPLMVDDNRQVFQLNSVNLATLRKFVGKRAMAKGTIDAGATPMQGATQVINVSSLTAANATSGAPSCTSLAGAIGATTSAAGLAAGAAGGAAGAAGGAAGAAGGAAGAAGGAAGAAGGAAAGAAAGAAGVAAGTTAAVVGGVAAAAGAVAGVVSGVANNNDTSPPL